MRYPSLFLLAILLVFGTDCSQKELRKFYPQVEAYDLSPDVGKYPKTDPNGIIVYAAPKFAPKNYVLLARLKSAGLNYTDSLDELYENFRKKAAEFGADGIILLETTQPGGRVLVETGHQPINDLGYATHSGYTTAVTQVIPQTPTGPSTKKFMGYALAIRSKP